MLRKRILASAMASVMAIGSVAVTASADVVVSQLSSKADLEMLFNEYDAFRDENKEDNVYNYGSIAGQRFLDAMDYADNVLNDADATTYDYAVAYKMLEQTRLACVKYTADQLRSLIKSYDSLYYGQNILNESIGDYIYDTEKYSVFEESYDEALSAVDSKDERIITDAYENLNRAGEAVKANKLPTVTKSQFRTALKNYENVLHDQYKYEYWRVGTVSDYTGNWNAAYNTTVAFGVLFAHIDSAQEAITAAYERLDEVKGLNSTTSEDIVKGYNAALQCVELYKAWEADSINRASKSNITKILKDYHNQLVYDFRSTDAEELFALINAEGALNKKYSDPNIIPGFADNGKTLSARLKIKAEKDIFVHLNDNGYWNGGIEFSEPQGDVKFKKIAKNATIDLLSLIEVNADIINTDENIANIEGNVDNGVVDGSEAFPPKDWAIELTDKMSPDILEASKVDIVTAMQIAEIYLGADNKDDFKSASELIKTINTANAVNAEDLKGASAEWTLVYRYLNYAFRDQFAGSQTASKTLADVEKLIDDSYDLAEKTGDASLFAHDHNELVRARQEARDWVKEYKKNGSASVSIDTAYKNLEEPYKALSDDLSHFAYTFGEIHEKLGQAMEAIDNGEIAVADQPELKTLINDTAYALSVVEPFEVENGFVDNDAFDTERYFQKDNRLLTVDDKTTISDESGTQVTVKDSNGTHKELKAKYEELKKRLDEMKAAPKVEKGDLDGVPGVNANDVRVLLQSILAGTQGSLDAAAADYNGDGQVNALDARAILLAVLNGTTPAT